MENRNYSQDAIKNKQQLHRDPALLVELYQSQHIALFCALFVNFFCDFKFNFTCNRQYDVFLLQCVFLQHVSSEKKKLYSLVRKNAVGCFVRGANR